MSTKCLVIVKYYAKLNIDSCMLTNKDDTSKMFQFIMISYDIELALTGILVFISISSYTSTGPNF